MRPTEKTVFVPARVWTFGLLFCGALTLAAPAIAEQAPNFNEHVAPIIFANCSGCHQPGQGTPFNLMEYKDVAKRAEMIGYVIEQRYMPPWHPKRGKKHYKNSRKLSKSDRSLILKWIKNGAPEGPAQKTPVRATVKTGGWKLGKPDLVIEMEDSFEVPASGPDIYRSFIAPIKADKRLYVKAIDIRSTAPEVLHHVLYFSSPAKQVRQLDKKSKKTGFRSMGYVRLTDLGGWAVGGQPVMLPEGLAREIPKGADIVLDSHFHPSGRKQNCKIQIAIYLAKEAPKQKLFSIQVPTLFGRFANIDIPAGEKEWVLKKSTKLSHDIQMISVAGHAHYLCEKMKSWAVTESGERIDLFEINSWDFNWQERYLYRKPIQIPKGSTLHAELVYNNSSSNPNNPFNPPRRIKWGQESTDEMGSVIFNVIMKNESERIALSDNLRQQFLNSKEGARLKMLMTQLKLLDFNGDKFVSKEELPKMYRNALQRLDRNGDGAIDMIEIETLGRRSGKKRFQAKPKKSSKPKPKKPKAKKREFF